MVNITKINRDVVTEKKQKTIEQQEKVLKKLSFYLHLQFIYNFRLLVDIYIHRTLPIFYIHIRPFVLINREKWLFLTIKENTNATNVYSPL